MTEALRRLWQEPITPKQLSPGTKGFKKAYFLERSDLIFDLVENKGIKYPAIIEAMKQDGVIFDYQYFRELMAKEKIRRSEGDVVSKPPSSQASGHNTTEAATPAAKAQTPQNEDICPQKAAFMAENARIKSLKITSKEKRAMLAKASEEYFKTLNPLSRK